MHEQVVVSLDPPPTVGVHTLPTEDLPDRIESSIGPLSIDHVVDTVYVLHRSITEPETATNRAFGNSIVPEVEDQTLRSRTPVAAGVPSAPEAAETDLVPAYTG